MSYRLSLPSHVLRAKRVWRKVVEDSSNHVQKSPDLIISGVLEGIPAETFRR